MAAAINISIAGIGTHHRAITITMGTGGSSRTTSGIMSSPSLPNAAELRRIIKETTGREVTTIELYRIWYYFEKVLLCSGLWSEVREVKTTAEQPNLF